MSLYNRLIQNNVLTGYTTGISEHANLLTAYSSAPGKQFASRLPKTTLL